MTTFRVLTTLIARCALTCALTVSMGWTADPALPATATVSIPQPTAAANWEKLDTKKPWELSLTVNAGSPFKAGTAASTSAGIEVWQTTADTESLASFTGKVPSNKPRKNYEPKFTGQFKVPDGSAAGGPLPLPVWLVNGRFTITCDYEKGLQKPGEGDGVVSLEEKREADETITVTCPVMLPDNIPNTSDALFAAVPTPSGAFKDRDVKLSTIDPRLSPASSNAAQPVACPQCKGNTLIRVTVVADLTGTFPWNYALPTWTQRAQAGPKSGKMWDTFEDAIGAHEAGHLAIFRSDYVTPVTSASTTFAKTACIGEVCFDPDASNGKAQAYVKARQLAMAQFVLARTTWAEALPPVWTAYEAKQATYETTTDRGANQSAVGGVDAVIIGGMNLNE